VTYSFLAGSQRPRWEPGYFKCKIYKCYIPNKDVGNVRAYPAWGSVHDSVSKLKI